MKEISNEEIHLSIEEILFLFINKINTELQSDERQRFSQYQTKS